ncbi:MAG: arginyltransferase [Kofleriaceae bacterium]|nr:arginyltransferase [Kofleriaceae bacterium]
MHVRPVLVPGDPPELRLVDQPEPCPYLPDRVARRPLRLPISTLEPAQLEARLDAGDRRYGRLLYTQHCPECRACEPIRVDVNAFVLNATQRRVLRRGDAYFTQEQGPTALDETRLALFNLHEEGRDLRRREEPMTERGYAQFLVESCTDTFELRYLHDGALAMLSVVDRSAKALSAVYTYYDPSLARLSPGVYAILKQLELCRTLGLPWLYLGLYIEENASMAYKGAYRPHERRLGGVWQRFEKGD